MVLSRFRRGVALAILGALLVGLGGLPGLQAAGETVEVTYTVARTTYKVGEQFTVAVACSKLDGATPVQGAFSCYLKHTFDAAVLRLDTVTYNTTYSNFNGREAIDNVAGTVDRVGATATVVVNNNTAQAPNTGTSVYELTFTVIGAGSSPILAEAVAASDPFSEITVLGLDTDQRDNVRFPSLAITAEAIDTNLNRVSLISPRNSIPAGDLLALTFYGQPDTTEHDISIYYPGAQTPFYAEGVNTAACADAVCVVEVPYNGTPGQYAVFIRPRVSATVGEYNASVFQVTTEPLQDVHLISPVGNIPAGDQLVLKFYAQAGTTAHDISVYNTNVNPALQYAQVVPTGACAGGLCTVKVPVSGDPGSFVVFVRPLAGTVGGNYTPSFFTVDSSALRRVEIIAPQSPQVPSNRLVLEFREVPGATAYSYSFTDPSQQPFGAGTLDAAACVDGLCRTVVPYNGAEGQYTVAVQAVNGPLAQGVFTVAQAALNPVPLLSPQGVIPSTPDVQLVFKMQPGTTHHMVVMNGPGGVVFQETVDAADCYGNVCAVPVNFDGALGNYAVTVQPFAGATGGPLADSGFTIANVGPAPVQLISPKGDVAATNQLALKFAGQAGAISHNVNVYNGGGQLIFSKLVDTRGCAGDVCTVYVPYDGAPGAYQVWIQAIGGQGGSVWAQSLFTVTNGVLTPVTLRSPQGTVQASDTLPLTFRAQPGVTAHLMNVYGPGGLILGTSVPTDTCTPDGICTVELPYDGAEGGYSVWIQPQAGALGGPWAGSNFTVGSIGLDAVSLTSPTGSILPGNLLTLTFDAQQGATDHVINVYGPGGLIEMLDVNTSACVGDTCTVHVPYDGAAGAYAVWIQPRSGNFFGPWNGSTFTVAEGNLTNVSLISPTGTIAPGNQLALRFNTQGGTTAHQVRVSGPVGVIFDTNVNTMGCSGATCTVAVPYGGQAGAYTVGITPYRGVTGGTTTNSTFTVGGALNPVSLASPTALIAPSNLLTLTWAAQGGTTAHRVDVYGPGGLVSGKLYDTAGCAGASCAVTVPYNGALGDYAVWILPYAGDVPGPWNGSTFAVVEPGVLSVGGGYLRDNLGLVSVCAGTWEVGNPLDAEITLTWEAYFADGDVQAGTVTVAGNAVATFYTNPNATGLSLIVDGATDVYTEATAACVE